MKKLLTVLITVLLTTNAVAAELKKVFISQVVEHPALDITTKGIIDGLEQNGYKRGDNLEIRVESAQASAALAAQIAAKFTGQKPDVAVGVGTISAQSFTKYARNSEVNLAFSTVTDPLGANIVKNLKEPGNNTSGVSNFVDLEPQIDMFKKLQPNLKRLGILYNPGELNSVSIVKKLEVLCPKLGIVLIKQVAGKTSDAAQAATKLAAQVDAIFISNDNTALAALSSVINVAYKAKIPVYVSDTDAVEKGALAALGPNQYQVGLQTGAMIARALNGENLGAIPVEFPDNTDLYINEEAAAVVGITIPEDVRSKAAKIIQKSK